MMMRVVMMDDPAGVGDCCMASVMVCDCVGPVAVRRAGRCWFGRWRSVSLDGQQYDWRRDCWIIGIWMGCLAERLGEWDYLLAFPHQLAVLWPVLGYGNRLSDCGCHQRTMQIC